MGRRWWPFHSNKQHNSSIRAESEYIPAKELARSLKIRSEDRVISIESERSSPSKQGSTDLIPLYNTPWHNSVKPYEYNSLNTRSTTSIELRSNNSSSSLKEHSANFSVPVSPVGTVTIELENDGADIVASPASEAQPINKQIFVAELHNGEELFLEGRKLAHSGDHKTAIQKFKIASELEPENWEYTFYLSQSQAALKGVPKVIHKESNYNIASTGSIRLSTVAEEDIECAAMPSFPRINSVAKYQITNSMSEESEDALDLTEPNNDFAVDKKAIAKVWYKNGLVFARAGNHKKAIEDYSEAISLDNTKPEYSNNVAFSYYMLGNIVEAEKWCKNILNLNPGYGPAHDTLAYIYKAKASNSRENGDESKAEHFAHIAVDEFHISKKYEKEVAKSKELYKAYIKLGAALTESGNIKEARKCFNKAENCLGKHPIKPPTDCNDIDALESSTRHQDALAYIGELKSYVTSDRHSRSGSDTLHVSQEKLKLVKKAADILKLGIPSKAIKELRAERDKTKVELAALKKEVADKADKDEVSIAIENNTHAKHISKQYFDIALNPERQEYYNAFRSILSVTYLSAKSVEGGQVSLDTDSLFQKGLTTALSFIPFCGTAISEIAEIGANLYNAAHIHKNAKLFLKIAVTVGEFEEIINQVALDITLHSHKSAEILSTTNVEHKVTGLLNKIIAKCKALKASVDKSLEGGELYHTNHAKLGVQNALEATEAFLKYASTLPNFCDKHEAIKCLKHAIIPEEHWIIDIQSNILSIDNTPTTAQSPDSGADLEEATTISYPYILRIGECTAHSNHTYESYV